MTGYRERLVSILGVVSSLVILAFCLFVDAPYPLNRSLTRWSGFALVAVGMLLLLWAITYIGKAFSGEIAPVLDYFVAQGPYRYVSHPVYLGLTTALVGLTLAFDNWLATVAVFVLFLPGQVIRARLEEGMLARHFGMAYEAYRGTPGSCCRSYARIDNFPINPVDAIWNSFTSGDV